MEAAEAESPSPSPSPSAPQPQNTSAPQLGRSGTPSFLDDEICLVPGEIVVRVEDAPGNARRIFTGVDVLASVEQVWGTLTDYENLHTVVPNLVSNEVLELYSADADRRKGARLSQVGAAKLMPGVSFKAQLTLDVQEYIEGMPDQSLALLPEALRKKQTTSADVRDYDARLPLRRGVFPRPFAYSSLPIRDISMQSVENAPGDFALYQGVWRMQPLTHCAPDGEDAMRLSYAVELRPALPVPVRLLEGRIARDLTENLQAIRVHAEALAVEQRLGQAQAAQAAP